MKNILRALFSSVLLSLPCAGFAQATQLFYNGQFQNLGEFLSGSTLQVDSGAAFVYKANSATTNQLLYVSNSTGLIMPLGLGAGLSISGGNLVAGSSTSANPTASVGLSVVNGSATSFMRSDAAPALSQAIVPTWTGLHTFFITSNITSGSDYGIKVTPTLNQRNASNFTMIYGNETVTQAGTGNQYLEELAVGGVDAWVVNSLGTVTVGGWNGSVIGSAYGGAGTVNGVLGANGSGTVSAATAGNGIALTTGPATISLASIANGTILANTTGITASPVATTLSALLDALGSTSQGAVIFRGSTGWTFLNPGTAGQVLMTGGAAANVTWAGVSAPTTVQHDVASYSNTTGGFEDLGIANFGSSRMTVTNSSSGATPALVVNNNASVSNQTWISQMYMPNMSAGASSEAINVFGVASATNNAAYIGFRYNGSGSSSNQVSIGFYTTNDVFSIAASGNLTITGLATKYDNIATAGWGVPAVYGHGRLTGQSAAVASVASYTVGGSDGSFEVSANVNVTASVTSNFSVTCTYKDETNTTQTLTLGFTQLAGATLLSAITNVTGTGPYESPVYHLRCKAGTAITIATTGTFTSVTYNVEGTIVQIG